MCIYLHITVFTYLHMHHHTPYYLSLEYNPHQTYFFFPLKDIFTFSDSLCLQPEHRKDLLAVLHS